MGCIYSTVWTPVFLSCVSCITSRWIRLSQFLLISYFSPNVHLGEQISQSLLCKPGHTVPLFLRLPPLCVWSEGSDIPKRRKPHLIFYQRAIHWSMCAWAMLIKRYFVHNLWLFIVLGFLGAWWEEEREVGGKAGLGHCWVLAYNNTESKHHSNNE